jgi:hypothetical protein
VRGARLLRQQPSVATTAGVRIGRVTYRDLALQIGSVIRWTYQLLRHPSQGKAVDKREPHCPSTSQPLATALVKLT